MTNTPTARLQGAPSSAVAWRWKRRTRQGLGQDARGAYIGKHMTMREMEELLCNVTGAEAQRRPEAAGGLGSAIEKGSEYTWKK